MHASELYDTCAENVGCRRELYEYTGQKRANRINEITTEEGASG